MSNHIIIELRNKVIELETTIERLTGDVQYAQHEATRRIGKLNDDNERLTRELADASQHSDTQAQLFGDKLDTLQAENDALQQKIKDLELDITNRTSSAE